MLRKCLDISSLFIPFGIVSLLHLLGMFRRMIFKREGNLLIFTRVWLEKKERFICAFVRSLKRLNILYYNFQKMFCNFEIRIAKDMDDISSQ